MRGRGWGGWGRARVWDELICGHTVGRGVSSALRAALRTAEITGDITVMPVSLRTMEITGYNYLQNTHGNHRYEVVSPMTYRKGQALGTALGHFLPLYFFSDLDRPPLI